MALLPSILLESNCSKSTSSSSSSGTMDYLSEFFFAASPFEKMTVLSSCVAFIIMVVSSGLYITVCSCWALPPSILLLKLSERFLPSFESYRRMLGSSAGESRSIFVSLTLLDLDTLEADGFRLFLKISSSDWLVIYRYNSACRSAS